MGTNDPKFWVVLPAIHDHATDVLVVATNPRMYWLILT